MFKIGDTVIHPGHGPCKVDAIQKDVQSDINGTTYILKPKGSAPGNFRILIAEEKIKKSGVRYPIGQNQISRVLQILKNEPDRSFGNSANGYHLTKEKIQSGNPYKIAKAIRILEKDDNHKYSSIKEELLQSAKKKLIDEIAYVKRFSKEEASMLVKNTLRQ